MISFDNILYQHLKITQSAGNLFSWFIWLIVIGGLPNITAMTGGRFTKGFNGCIHGFEVQDSNTMDLGAKAVSGINVKPCSR